MKLLKCHIENFGKLSNYDYEFKEGLNTIKEENGFGKTTFASFIKAMFYGLETKKNTKMLIDRKKYQPWQGGAYGGSIEFEVNGKKYKIERFFEKKEVDDTCKIYDLSTNLETNEYTSNIGEEIFKLNKEAYERSTFISGQNIETTINDSISAKLGNILENENDVNTSEQAIKLLDESIKNYKKTGGRGEINEKILEKSKLEKKLEQSKIDEKALQERIEKNDQIKQTLKEKQEEQEKLKNMLTQKIQEEAQKAKWQNYKILQTNVEQSKKNLKIYEEFFKEEIPTEEEIETLIEKAISVEKYKAQVKNYENDLVNKEKLNNLDKTFKNQEITEEEINIKISNYNKINEIKNKIEINKQKISNIEKEQQDLIKQHKKERKTNMIIGISSTIFIIIGIIAAIKQIMQIYIPTLVIGIIGIILFFIKNKITLKNTKESIKKDKELKDLLKIQEDLNKEIQKLNLDIEEFLNKYSKNGANTDTIIKLTEIKAEFIKYKDLKNSTKKAQEKQEEVVKKLTELEDSIKEYIKKYFNEITQSYVNYAQEIKLKKSEFARQIQDYETKQKEKELFEKENDIKKLQEFEEKQNEQQIEKNQIEEKVNNLAKEINKLNDEKNYNKNQIDLLESNLETVFDIENELEELNQKIEDMEANCKILEKTKKFLETAKEQFSAYYLKDMKQNFIKNITLMNGKEMNINLDVNLNVQINEQGSNKELRYFSTGYKDLIYMCMRLSLIDSLFEEEKPFIILDDPFVNLDEDKIKNATNLLKNISKQYQIIYFICHESRQ